MSYYKSLMFHKPTITFSIKHMGFWSRRTFILCFLFVLFFWNGDNVLSVQPSKYILVTYILSIVNIHGMQGHFFSYIWCKRGALHKSSVVFAAMVLAREVLNAAHAVGHVFHHGSILFRLEAQRLSLLTAEEVVIDARCLWEGELVHLGAFIMVVGEQVLPPPLPRVTKRWILRDPLLILCRFGLYAE